MNRRDFILTGVALSNTACVSTGVNQINKASLYRSGPVSSLRAPEWLGVTLGSVLGTSLEIAAYAVLTTAVPGAVLLVFASAVSRGIVGNNLLAANRSYIDYRMDEAGDDPYKANTNVQLALGRDLRDFSTLDAKILSLGSEFKAMRSSSDTTLREIRELRDIVRADISTLREEQVRAQTASATTEFTKRVLNPLPRSERTQTENMCDQVSEASGKLKLHIQALEREVLSG